MQNFVKGIGSREEPEDAQQQISFQNAVPFVEALGTEFLHTEILYDFCLP